MVMIIICNGNDNANSHNDNNRPQRLQILKPGDDGGLAAGRAAAATTSSCGEGGRATLFLDEARGTLVATCDDGPGKWPGEWGAVQLEMTIYSFAVSTLPSCCFISHVFRTKNRPIPMISFFSGCLNQPAAASSQDVDMQEAHQQAQQQKPAAERSVSGSGQWERPRWFFDFRGDSPMVNPLWLNGIKLVARISLGYFYIFLG